MNIIKAISTLVFIFIASVANSETTASEEVRSSYQFYANISHSGFKKTEHFNKGEYVIKNEGQCESIKEASFECSILNLDKTIENRKKNNELNIWNEIGCIYSFDEFPDSALEKVEINNIDYYEYEGNYYIRVFQDRYYKNTDKVFSLSLMLQVTGEGNNKAYYASYAIRRNMIPTVRTSCSPSTLDEKGYRIENYKRYYYNTMGSAIKREYFNKGEYVIKNKGQCESIKEASFECSILNLDKTIKNRKKNNEPNIWEEGECEYSFTNLPNKPLERVEINNIDYYEHDGSSYVIVNQDRHYKKIDEVFSLRLILKVTGEGNNKAYYTSYAIRQGGFASGFCSPIFLDKNGYRLD